MLLRIIAGAALLAVPMLAALVFYACCIAASKADRQNEEQFKQFMKEREQDGDKSRSDGDERTIPRR